jgi:molybdate transport system substrate-binding protein
MNRALLLASAACAFAWSAHAAEVRVFGTGAVQHSVQAIAADFEKETGHKIVATFGTAGAIGKRLEAGEKADVVLSSSGGLRDAKALIADGEPVVVGRVRMGMAAKPGAPKIDISTPETFKAALLAAPAVAYADPAQGSTTGVHFGKVLEQAGIADQVKAKAVLGKDGFDVGKAIADGKAPIGFTQATEIMAVPGAEVAGYLPDAYQLVSSYAIALTREGEKSEAAKSLYARITGPKGVDVFAHHGFEVKK